MAPTWKPAVELDLETASGTAFQDTISKFNAWSKAQPPVTPLKIQNGWREIDGACAEDLLRRNPVNRKPALKTVKKYHHAMKTPGGWRRTGQAILINQDGKVEDGQHRLLAAYLGKVTFHTYVVSDVPVQNDLFAFIDDMKPRSAVDALYTSGNNGSSGTLSNAIKLAWRYDNMAIGIIQQPKSGRDMTITEVLEYAQQNKDLGEAVHQLQTTYNRATQIIDNKPVAAFFIWRATKEHGVEVVDAFLDSLGSGAMLTEDSPVLALRNRLLSSQGEVPKSEELRPPRRLALLIKGFLMYVGGQKATKKDRKGLTLLDNETFPRLELENQPQHEDMQHAAD